MIDLRLAAIVLAIATPAFAETRVTERVSYGTANNFFDPLSNNLIAYRTEIKYDEFEQPDDDRLKLAAMHCFGSFTIVRGITTGGGTCTMTDVNCNTLAIQEGGVRQQLKVTLTMVFIMFTMPGGKV